MIVSLSKFHTKNLISLKFMPEPFIFLYYDVVTNLDWCSYGIFKNDVSSLANEKARFIFLWNSNPIKKH